MIKFFKSLRKDTKGSTLIEYGLIAALVSIAAITVLTALGTNVESAFETVSTTLENS